MWGRCLLLQTQACAVAELSVLRICAPHSACRPLGYPPTLLLPCLALICSSFAGARGLPTLICLSLTYARPHFSLTRSHLQVMSTSVPTSASSIAIAIAITHRHRHCQHQRAMLHDSADGGGMLRVSVLMVGACCDASCQWCDCCQQVELSLGDSLQCNPS